MEKQKNGNESRKKERLARKMEFLDNPDKRGDIPPEQLLSMIAVKQGDTFLDLGAGTGYLTIPAAKASGGMVYALDVDSDMLEVIESKAKKHNLMNVRTLKGNIDDLPLPGDSVDIAIASLVLHEVDSLSHSLQQIRQVIKPEGYFVCVELEKQEEDGHHPRIAHEDMEQEMIKEGFRVIKKLKPTDKVYILLAQK
ncbi:methyltransferase domain-containing protein [Sediminibacillus dalangtanensis]|uniref:Methyltransferase domain-containing protein n=1 Tax=Sediminibacillus dalangtanensis TaxID=2729421 RepID=A0ABX7VRN4_9BACI|nr:class I SAM-dependent methyltransferase [Sediminibacillus dalangtanensis]QTM98225.1 methyltransferase domain-containing protein [Sediminibacillus dalangtanensis]